MYFFCVIMVELKPSHVKKVGKIKDSLIALLVLMIEFRREEGRETTFVPWNGSLPRLLSHSGRDQQLKAQEKTHRQIF